MRRAAAMPPDWATGRDDRQQQGQSDLTQSGRTQSGPHTGPVAPGGARPGTTGPASSPAGLRAPADPRSPAGREPFARPDWPTPATNGGPATSRYYDQDLASDAEPGYSMLAVSDPAADVTSTQTWQAVGDGRATGTWTAPARPGGGPAAPPGRGDAGPAMPGPGPMPDPDRSPDRGRAQTGLGRRGSADLGEAVWPGATGSRAGATGSRAGAIGTAAGDAGGRPDASAAAAGIAGSRAGNQTAEPSQRATRGHSGAHTSPQRSPRPPRQAEPAGSGSGKPRRKHPANVKLAMATALVLVLAAAAALSYAVLRGSGSPHAAGPAASKPPASPSVSAAASPSLGPYGHISSRSADPTPLTMAELYPTTFTVSSTSVLRTAASKGTNCAAELVGSRIQSAIGSAGCNQVVRATYLASAQGLMGTIGVLNLSSAKAAAKAVRSADASDFISQLGAKHGPTHRIGQGTGIEEAAAKGHYLILIWAEFTNLRKPRTTGQRTAIEQFMTELLQNTANVSLTSRMLSGAP
jgi:hypothetical protein